MELDCSASPGWQKVHFMAECALRLLASACQKSSWDQVAGVRTLNLKPCRIQGFTEGRLQQLSGRAGERGQGDASRAWQHLDKANRLQRSRIRYSSAGSDALAGTLRELFLLPPSAGLGSAAAHAELDSARATLKVGPLP